VQSHNKHQTGQPGSRLSGGRFFVPVPVKREMMNWKDRKGSGHEVINCTQNSFEMSEKKCKQTVRVVYVVTKIPNEYLPK